MQEGGNVIDRKRAVRSVMLVVATNNVAGTETVVAAIGQALHSTGTTVHVVFPRDERLDEFAAACAEWAFVHRIGGVTGHRALWRNWAHIAWLCRRHRPAIVHIHYPSYRWGMILPLGVRIGGACLVRTEHNPLLGPPDRVAGAALRITDRLTHTFTYVSSGNRRRYEAQLQARTRRGVVIPNGYSTERFLDVAHHGIRSDLGIGESSRLAISVGTYGGRRPLGPIVEAMTSLAAHDAFLEQDWHLLVAGTGAQSERDFAAASAVGDRVHFLGQRTDVAALLQQSELFVTASHYEGMSLSMLEAWAGGLSVLAPDVDGIDDILDPDSMRAVVVRERTPEAFSERWRQHIDGTPEWIAGQQQARQRVLTEHTDTKMAEDYLALYEQVIDHETHSG